MRKYAKILEKESLSKLKTKQLLSRLKLLHKCESSYLDSDLTSSGIQNPDSNTSELIIYKDSKKWIDSYNDLKEELSKREHISKKINKNNSKNHLVLKGQRTTFELKLLKYQFEHAIEYYDLNWLVIKITVKNSSIEFSKKCACILTWEIKSFLKFLESILEVVTIKEHLLFLETDFQLKYLGKYNDKYKFNIILKDGLSFENKKNTIKISIIENDIKESIKYLYKCIDKFPIRVK